jgi:hypothetical protein
MWLDPASRQGFNRAMISEARASNSLVTHAACMAAGVRDSLRTAQFYARDMAKADGHTSETPRDSTFLSRAVAWVARIIDSSLSKAADVSVRLIRPQWRKLPSPFEPSMRQDVVQAIKLNQFSYTSQFTAYFFRAARHMLERGAEAPHLVLEHRIESARRALETEPRLVEMTEADSLAHVLLRLVLAGPIARCGAPKPGHEFLTLADPNIAVMATACLALLLAEEGKPLAETDDDEFFEISGALLAPHFGALNKAIEARDVAALARVLETVKGLY